MSGGAVLYRKTYGTADLASGRALDPDTAFETGSLTKQMTAVAVLQLVAAHRIALTDRVDKFVPGYRAAAAVTVAQLLQQVSGIPDFAASPAFAAGATSQPTDFAHVLGTVDAQPLDFSPGKRWKYSNTNYLLLGHLVELVSKTIRHVPVSAGACTGGDAVGDDPRHEGALCESSAGVRGQRSARCCRRQFRQQLDRCCRKSRGHCRRPDRLGPVSFRGSRAAVFTHDCDAGCPRRRHHGGL